MKQIVIPRSGGTDVLTIKEAPDPAAEAGQVVVETRAAGINFADVLARQGLYPDAPGMPCVVGYEIAGVVREIGAGVEGFKVGDKVFGMTRFGGYSSVVSVPAGQLFPMPDTLSFEQAASIPVVYLTAFQLLVVMGSLRKGEKVLIHNAGGGVGLAALDIARNIGAVTIGTASPGKHLFLKERGLEHAIDYRSLDWEKELNKLTDGKGVELVIDPLGGSHWKKSYRALRATGRLGMFGISTASESNLFGFLKLASTAAGMPFFHPVNLMNTNKSVFGVNMGRLWDETEKIREWMHDILEGVRAGWARPHVDKSFAFERAGEAHAYLEARKNIGKVVLIP